MSTFFLIQGFPSTIVNRAVNRVQPVSCTSAFTLSLPSRNSDRVPLYPLPTIPPASISCYFCHCQPHIFPSPPLSTFHRDRSLRDTLVHSSFTPMAPSPAYTI
eukprot:g23852.t1